MTLIRSLCDCPLTVLGSLFGNRDHSTVLHALQTTSKKLEKDLTIQASVEQIVDKLRLLAGFHRLPLPAALQGESMFHKQTN
jgi:metal-dependent HD superfamily phosphatase/phosphodiesterase